MMRSKWQNRQRSNRVWLAGRRRLRSLTGQKPSANQNFWELKSSRSSVTDSGGLSEAVRLVISSNTEYLGCAPRWYSESGPLIFA